MNRLAPITRRSWRKMRAQDPLLKIIQTINVAAADE